MISEEAVLDFAGSWLKSVWALELLLVLKRDPERVWDAPELIRELRSSQVVVTDALSNLLVAGLVVEQDTGRYRYHPVSPDIDELASALQRIYAIKPAAVIRKIVTTSNSKLEQLSNAFRFKND